MMGVFKWFSARSRGREIQATADAILARYHSGRTHGALRLHDQLRQDMAEVMPEKVAQRKFDEFRFRRAHEHPHADGLLLQNIVQGMVDTDHYGSTGEWTEAAAIHLFSVFNDRASRRPREGTADIEATAKQIMKRYDKERRRGDDRAYDQLYLNLTEVMPERVAQRILGEFRMRRASGHPFAEAFLLQQIVEAMLDAEYFPTRAKPIYGRGGRAPQPQEWGPTDAAAAGGGQGCGRSALD
jgi:hypothetical protein